MLKDRVVLFLAWCIPIRLSMAALAYYIKNSWGQMAMGLIGLAIGLGFISAFLRGNMTGFFGGNAWWHNVRLVHAFMYLMYSIDTLIIKTNKAYLYLVVDVIIGLLGFMLKSLK